MIPKIVRHYIELALREELARSSPGYCEKSTEMYVKENMKKLTVTRNVLYRAIELACETGSIKGDSK